MIRDNHIIVDLNKAIYAKHYYENQHGQQRRTLAKGPTSFGDSLPEGYARPVPGHKETHGETTVEAAKRLGILDVWKPVTLIQFANNHAIEFTGEKAQSIWKAWNEKIFKRK